jgi:hypothetical protein
VIDQDSKLWELAEGVVKRGRNDPEYAYVAPGYPPNVARCRYVGPAIRLEGSFATDETLTDSRGEYPVGCIFGQEMLDMGIPVETLRKFDQGKGGVGLCIEEVVEQELAEWFGYQGTADEKWLVETMSLTQSDQDCGGRWGGAVMALEEFMAEARTKG